jgi:uncharacterized protein (TIGR03663 family)
MLRQRRLGVHVLAHSVRCGAVAAVLARRRSLRPEVVLAVVVVGAAAALRVVDLGAKPFHHDESLDAWFSWRLADGHPYHYDPAYHGPLRFFLTAPLYWLLGASDTSARLLAAGSGTVAVALAFALRRPLGRPAAVASAVLLAVSPSFLYYSRFAREDIVVAALSLGFLVVVLHFLRAPARWQPPAAAALLAAHFATKETAFLAVLVTGSAMAASVLRRDLRRRRGRDLPAFDLVARLRAPGADAWWWAATAFAVLFTVAFTVFLTNPGGLEDGLLEGLGYWWSQHDVRKGSQPWFFYLVLLGGYEWLAVALAAVGAVHGLRRRDPVVAFLLWQAVGNLVVYSWAGEKFAWLVLHPLLPVILLAGAGVQVLWERRGRNLAWTTLAVVALALVATTAAAVGAAFDRPADGRELLVSVQTSTDVLATRATIEGLLAQGPRTIEIDGFGGTTWPWAWYLRDEAPSYPDMSDPAFRPSADIVLVDDLNHEAVAARLDGWEGHRYRFRVWWLPDYGDLTPAAWFRWLVHREPWSPTATFDQWIYIRDGLTAEP